MSKLISIIGAPQSGKSTIASSVQSKLKKLHKNSMFVGEAATDYIANNGVPTTPTDQIIIFYKQLEKEKMFLNIKDYIICDSSTLLNYFYFRSLFPNPLSAKDITTINHIQKEILNTINSWYRIYYVPPIYKTDTKDGIRFHDNEEIRKIDRLIKSYLEIENIPYIDLSNVDIDKRSEYIIKDIS